MRPLLISSPAGQLLGMFRRGFAYLDYHAGGRSSSPTTPARITFIEPQAAADIEAIRSDRTLGKEA